MNVLIINREIQINQETEVDNISTLDLTKALVR